MKFDIRTQGFELTDALSEHVHRRMIFALHRFHHRLGQRATVHLSDENGPKGGVDMRCVIHVPMPGRKEVVIREDGDDLYVAGIRFYRFWLGLPGTLFQGSLLNFKDIPHENFYIDCTSRSRDSGKYGSLC